MLHYLFTNDLRISKLKDVLIHAAECIKENKVPSAEEDKNENNNINTLGFYFNLTPTSNCTYECLKGNVRRVVLNFIKKFQFPNPRTSNSLKNAIDDGIRLAPLRIILQILYLMKNIYPDQAYLSIQEIGWFIFFNEDIALSKNPNLGLLIEKIIEQREKQSDREIPDDLEKLGIFWKQCKRQLREMVKILSWSGCVIENDERRIQIHHDNLTMDNKADLFDIITFSDYWTPPINVSDDEIKKSYQTYIDLKEDEITFENVDKNILSEEKDTARNNLRYKTNYKSSFSRNRIVFGAPGTGKSYTVNQDRKKLLGEDNETDYERVTFHPDYSYANFVGTYKPVPRKDEDGKESITYEYVPGPFMRVYVDALKNSRTDNVKPFLLIIEEINRANVAAVFGDIFQLLDRDNGNVSEYPVQASEDLKMYLARELGGEPNEYNKIRIPDNMFIWATMNSADQGVFPMDTAFKRRWDFTYMGIDNNDTEIAGKTVTLGKNPSQRVEWNKLRKAINHFLTKNKINEDKQLGPYFIAKKIVIPEIGDEINKDDFAETFKNKVIMYLFEDAARQKRPTLFEGCSKGKDRYSDICREFDQKGIRIFNNDIISETEGEDLNISVSEVHDTVNQL